MDKIEKIKYICIACPIGCHLDVDVKNNKIDYIEGNKCKRGIDYALNEYTDPKRMVTVTCRIDSDIVNRVPVKTTEAISKKYIDNLVTELYQLNLATPILVGDIVLKNYEGTGVNIVATRSLKK